MYSNMFLSVAPIENVEAYYYMPDQVMDPKEFYKVMKGLENKLFRRGFSTCTRGDNLIVVGCGKLNESERINKFTFSLSKDKIVLTPAKNQQQLKQLVYSALKQVARKKGYESPETQKFFKKEAYKKGFFTYHQGFYCAIDVFNDGRIGIWLDPTVRWRQTIPCFVEWCKQHNRFEKKLIRDYLIGKTALCPEVKT